MRKYRFYITIFISLMLILLAGILRPESYESGLPIEMFWLRKISWKAHYNLVLTGDSRIYRGLSPAKMKLFLPDYNICNFGFSGTGFEQNYLNAATNLLNVQSNKKIILLGITPLSLTPSAIKNNGFLSYKQISKADIFIMNIFGNYLHFIRPFQIEDIYNQMTGKGYKYYQHFNPDGWVASFRVPEEYQNALELYKGYFENNYVDEQICENIFTWINRTRSQDVIIIGFRIPTSNKMIELENTYSGFNEESFIKRFTIAGGVWLDFSHYNYHIYDGSHLRKDSAIQLSYDLSKKIADFINPEIP